MSAENIDQTSSWASPFEAAFLDLDRGQTTLLTASSNWFALRGSEETTALLSALETTSQAFGNLTHAIANEDELEYSERSSLMAAIYKESDTSRVQNFKQLAPKGKFTEEEASYETLSKNLCLAFEEGVPPEDIAKGVVWYFLNGLKQDMDRLVDAEPMSFQAGTQAERQTGSSFVEVGKLAAVTFLGGVILYSITRKRNQ